MCRDKAGPSQTAYDRQTCGDEDGGVNGVTMGKIRDIGLVFAASSLLAGAGCFGTAGPSARYGKVGAGPGQQDHLAWWRDARFGMFIHWGLYAIPAGEWNGKQIGGIGEWIMNTAKIPVEEYEQLTRQFNPIKFSARQWVSLAKEAGMKYIVITSKHHDGFCLFDSKLTDYDVVDATPFKRDILKELSDECHKQGIKMCWYHSIIDWHHPDYLPRRNWEGRSTKGADLNRYIDYMKGQLRELLTNYGDIGVLWFDGGWEHSADELRAREVIDMIRSIQPNIVINNRLGLPQDYETPEQFIPATGIAGRDWETCMTMNDTWGFKKNDRNWKSTEELVLKLVDIASKGGNFLLNVGPTAEGLIPEPSVERLQAIGRWLSVNGDSIYGTAASPFRKLRWGRCTAKPDKLYLHVFDWPQDGKLKVPGLKNKVKKAYLLADKRQTKLTTAREDEANLVISVPAEAPDPIDSVIVLEIEGKPAVIAYTAKQGKDGSVELKAADATVHGNTARYEFGGGKDNIGYWTNPKDYISWDFKVTVPGAFNVEISYACAAWAGGSEYSVSVGNQKLASTVEYTGSWTKFVTEKLGTLKVTEPGKYSLSVRSKTMPHGAVMNLKSIILAPIKRQ